ncbi:5-formyltetrahydrofolate cyclo-ligase [Campylobacter sp. JMF_01 NE2]|uniref:5-formyltetrahydrofolate cyclo-ligase n=1 Tax=unclassified Campylobacter TaxID=2593542 RepID=UPI0022E9AAAB|nr:MULTISPECIES: 5-formyltetrahydrofolate cyclo-ligase [unclassified Campylobacter]MDA3053072.1 5-formyltetrahydrofolate cyclo-ligase [Campylobacter sp. JMF_03 NE3]MDA3067403.1 5-formyltetrahydrofolate cyclo-ligase [Campylobacter sp. JMF_01 NE2]
MEKNEFRKICKSRLKFRAKISAKCTSYIISRRIANLIRALGARKILIFLPLKYEPEILFLKNLMGKKCEFYLPRITDINLKMVKFRLPFVKSHFGLRETLPQNGYFGKVDLAVIPVVGVDGRLARIGHGKGYYDMFFSGLKHKPTVVFVSLEDCFTNEILSLSHDVVGDFYITPSKNYFKRGKYDRDLNRLVRSCGGRWHRVWGS